MITVSPSPIMFILKLFDASQIILKIKDLRETQKSNSVNNFLGNLEEIGCIYVK
jgi:hypothetical protein